MWRSEDVSITGVLGIELRLADLMARYPYPLRHFEGPKNLHFYFGRQSLIEVQADCEIAK